MKPTKKRPNKAKITAARKRLHKAWTEVQARVCLMNSIEDFAAAVESLMRMKSAYDHLADVDPAEGC